jgi:pyruvate, water dikinase
MLGMTSDSVVGMDRSRAACSWRAATVGLAMAMAAACTPPATEEHDDPCGPGARQDEHSGACVCEPGFHGDPDVECPAHADLCGEAEARVGHPVCAHTIEDDAQWTRLSIGGGLVTGGTRRLGKYMVPVAPTSRLPTVFSDANSYRLHYCLMSAGFAPLFPGLTTADHARLILTHAGREFYAGAIYELPTTGPVRFGFSIETAIRPDEMLPAETVYTVYRHLADRFAPGELGYVPRGTLQEDAAAGWADPPFEVLAVEGDEVAYEVYTPGIAYGRVRTSAGDEPSGHGWQDIVVFDEVPADWEGVFAATITGQRQDVLSHLNVLSAQRGTPNFFVDDATDAFAQFEGQLVRVEADAGNYTLRAATQAEAEAHWELHRPAAVVENPAEFEHVELDAFTEIPTDTAEERALARSRFGAKTVGLATLSRLIDPRHQTVGLGVPFHWYGEFMSSNAWLVDLGDGPAMHSYAETIAAWLEDEAFRTDSSVRKDRLARLRSEMQTSGVVPPALVEALHERIVTVFGSDTVMVRIRSSSNAEDTPTFNGAGLYESTSACAADSLAAADPGASACDPTKERRTLERGLARVWSSLWSYGAFEERDYYQLDHASIAMGATISLRYEDEAVNGVAFTGNPADPRQARFTVNAQIGEVDVVAPTPGVTAELSLLTIAGGEVVEIERIVPSTLVSSGQTVMSDAQLEQLGRLMAELEQSYPVDHQVEGAPAPLLDLEFKITDHDELVIKQIRTFLPTAYASDPSCLD